MATLAEPFKEVVNIHVFYNDFCPCLDYVFVLYLLNSETLIRLKFIELLLGASWLDQHIVNCSPKLNRSA